MSHYTFFEEKNRKYYEERAETLQMQREKLICSRATLQGLAHEFHEDGDWRSEVRCRFLLSVIRRLLSVIDSSERRLYRKWAKQKG